MSRKNQPKSVFSANLEAAIKSSGLSKKEVAERLGIAPQALTKYINGRIPGGEILMNMSRVLHVSTDYLLGISQKTNNDWQQRALEAEGKLAELKEVLPLLGKANSMLTHIVSK